MPNFDYIESGDLRESLERDFAEMQSSVEASAWKAVQVLAGSIVEALLIDYLTSTTNANRPAKDPLKLDLSEAIAICKEEGVLSERTADLCSVVRSYRNLIHPGRIVRLGEPLPDKGTATIAVALIEVIAEELAVRRRAAVGLNAEQLLSKLLRDSNSVSLLKYLLVEVPEAQKKKLLLKLIPEAYADAAMDDFDTSADRLKLAFRQIFEAVDEASKKMVASKFVEILRDADGHEVTAYSHAFFMGADLEFVPERQRAMVKDHVLDRTPKEHTLTSISLLSGVEEFLEPSDRLKWVDPIVRTLLAKTVSGPVKDSVRRYFLSAASSTSGKFDAAVLGRLDDWVRHFEGLGNKEGAELIKALKSDYDTEIPF